MSVKNILKYFAHAVAQATNEVVGDMKCFADTSLKRREFFIDINLYSYIKVVIKIWISKIYL
ncbi:hypothetical protein [Romboutsia ilealis]|uniref:hypothetical protein n=1 Tax=Romboutsia ilealis TaxID=1115758 RepID=UPI0025B7451A|nr:hypothetical protein [Romboutsia ilealis]